jgi:hypothetical protein
VLDRASALDLMVDLDDRQSLLPRHGISRDRASDRKS